MISKFTHLIKSQWIFIFALSWVIASCGSDENNDAGLPTITQINFSTSSATVAENSTSPVTIDLVLSKPLEADGSVIISFDNSSTASDADFSTNPAMADGKVVLDVPVGATSTSFTVTAIDNDEITEDKTIVFMLTDAKKGLELATSGLKTTVTLTNDDELQGTISTSVSALDDFGGAENGATTPSKNYTVSGAGLTADLVVTAPDNFQISMDDASFSSSLTVPVATANAAPVTIYARFAPATGTEQAISGNITHSAAGTTDVLVAVSGSETGGVPAVDPVFVDNFDYGSAAGDITALSPWANYSGPEAFIQYNPSGLTFSGYAGTGGGAIDIVNGAGSREDITRDIPPQTSGTVYTAQLVKVSSSSVTGDFFHSLREGGTYYNRLYAMDDGAGNLIFGTARTRTDGGDAVFGTTTYSFNTTYLAVIKYDFDTRLTSLYIISGAIPDTEPASAEAVANTGREPVSLNEIIYRQSSDNTTVTVDGIRIANTWKDVLGL